MTLFPGSADHEALSAEEVDTRGSQSATKITLPPETGIRGFWEKRCNFDHQYRVCSDAHAHQREGNNETIAHGLLVYDTLQQSP